MEVKIKATSRTGTRYLPFLGIIIFFSLLALVRIFLIRRKMRHTSRPGRAISADLSSVGMPHVLALAKKLAVSTAVVIPISQMGK